MDYSSFAFFGAGLIGCVVAVLHGIILQKSMIPAIVNSAKLPQNFRRLVTPLLHFSTLSWFFGGLALMAAPLWMDNSAKLTTVLFVGLFYAFGAVGNFWGTRGKLPGWMLLAVAVFLICIGVFA